MICGEIAPIIDDLIDYKFFCFDGSVKMVYVINGRRIGEGAKLGVYTADFNKLNVFRNDEFVTDEIIPKPENYEQMLFIARELSKEFPHVRVDLYNIKGKIYFGELTFYDGSGYMSYTPDSFDAELGSYFKI